MRSSAAPAVSRSTSSSSNPLAGHKKKHYQFTAIDDDARMTRHRQFQI